MRVVVLAGLALVLVAGVAVFLTQSAYEEVERSRREAEQSRALTERIGALTTVETERQRRALPEGATELDVLEAENALLRAQIEELHATLASLQEQLAAGR